MDLRKLFVCLLAVFIGTGYAQNPVTIRTGARTLHLNLPDNGKITCSEDRGVVKMESREPGDRMRIIVQFHVPPVLSSGKKTWLSKSSGAGRIEQARAGFEHALNGLYTDAVQKYAGVPMAPPRITHAYRNCFSGAALEVPRCMVSELSELTSVKRVYEDAEVKKCLRESVPMIGADKVWQTTGLTGEGVMVGVIDTGIDYTHPSLGGGLGSGYKVIGGYDIYNRDDDPMDDNGHGTHVAGIIAGKSDKINGVAPDAKLMAFKVLNHRGSGFMSDVILGIEMAVDPDGNPETDDGVDIINISLGHASRDPEDPDCQAVNTAAEAGVVCVVAAGNEGFFGYETIGAPAIASGAIAVGAVDKGSVRADFSSMGPVGINETVKPDLMAPGDQIGSSELDWTTLAHSGTSMAAPHVAGVAALLCQKYPDVSPALIKGVLCGTAGDLGENLFRQGSGLVDALRAVQTGTSVTPNNLGMGVADADADVCTVRKTLTVHNLKDETQDYFLSLRHTLQPGVDVSLDRNRLSLGSGMQDSVVFTMTVDNGLVPQLDDYPGSLEGWIDVISLSDTLAVPFSLLHMPSIQLEFEGVLTDLQLYRLGDDQDPEPLEFYNLESPANLIIPSGDYDLHAEFYRSDIEYHIFKTVHFRKSARIHLSKEEAGCPFYPEIDASLAVENMKYSYWRRYFMDNRTGMSTVTFHFGEHQIMPFYTSAFNTDRFSMGWIQVMEGYDGNIYYLCDGLNEPFSGDQVLSVNRGKLKEILFTADVNHLVDIPLSRLGYEAVTYDGTHITSFNREHEMPLDSYSHFRLHVMPQDDHPLFYVKFSYFREDLFDTIDGLYWNSPYWTFHEDRMLSTRFKIVEHEDKNGFDEIIDEQRTMMVPDSGAYYGLAICPPCPRQGFEIQKDAVKIPFQNFRYQAGDYRTSKIEFPVDYSLVLNGQLISDGVTTDSLIQLPGQGKVSLNLTYKDQSTFGNYTGDVEIEAVFDASRPDPSPPQLTGLRLLSDGFLINPYATPGEITLEADFEDEGTVAGVTGSYRVAGDTAWHELVMAHSENTHTTRLPAELVQTWVDVRLSAADASGNSLNYTLLPAYLNQGVTRASRFRISPSYVRPGQTVTFNADVMDSDGLSGVEIMISSDDGIPAASLVLYDDGQHADGSAGDHRYGAFWTLPGVPAQYRSALVTTDHLGNTETLPEVLSFTTQDRPDLYLLHSTVTRQPEDSLGTLVFMNAGADTAFDVQVTFGEMNYDVTVLEEIIGHIPPDDSLSYRPPLVVSRWVEDATTFGVPLVLSSGSYTWNDTLTIMISGNAGPDINSPMLSPVNPGPGDPVHLESWLYDENGVLSLTAYIIDDGSGQNPDTLTFIRGEKDEYVDYYLFTAEWNAPAVCSNFSVILQAEDSLGNISRDPASLRFCTLPFPSGEADVLVMGRFESIHDESIKSILGSLEANEYTYDIWNRTYRGFIDYMVLQKYLKKVVIWHPDVYELTDEQIEWGDTETPDFEERYKIKRYLDQGGNLLVTQSGFTDHIGDYDQRYEIKYLYYKKEEIASRELNALGSEGDPIGEGLTLSFEPGTPLGGMKPRRSKTGAPVLKTPDGQAIAIRTSKDGYNAVTLGFDFRTITDEADRNMLMARVVQWFRSMASPVHENSADPLPAEFVLRPSYPNPFNAQTLIPFELPEQAEVSIRIYDILGRRVADPVIRRVMDAGFHMVAWDGVTFTGAGAATGVYFVTFKAGTFRSVQKMMLLR
ncbi:S8 family serine peptidase [bacterium]|nr:S8 family serine peptidase [bacterium]